MILLALAFFIAAAYNLWAGETLAGVIALEIGLVLALARFIVGPVRQLPLLGRVKLGAGILLLVLLLGYVTQWVFDRL